MWRKNFRRVLLSVILPIGLFFVLTGMLWLSDHGRFPKLFLLFALPTLLLLLIEPSAARRFVVIPIVASVIAFASYISLSISWSNAEESAFDLIKRPLLVLTLIFGVSELGRNSIVRLFHVVAASAVLAVGVAIYEIFSFLLSPDKTRLANDRALYNPLLISHVFGFYASLWLGWLFTRRGIGSIVWTIPAVGALILLLVLTGSRTPLLAIAGTLLWLVTTGASRRHLVLLIAFLSAGVLTACLFPEMLTQRGLSYRPQIWAEAISQIGQDPLFGHGYGTPLRIKFEELAYAFHDPHNLWLAVLYDGGVVGLAFWLTIYAVALRGGWRHRHQVFPTIASAAVVYGLVAGMTEGGSFLTRPKEHWFLIWVPLALLATSMLRECLDGKKPI